MSKHPKMQPICWGERFLSRKTIGTLKEMRSYEIIGCGRGYFGDVKLDSWVLKSGEESFEIPQNTLTVLYENGVIRKI